MKPPDLIQFALESELRGSEATRREFMRLSGSVLGGAWLMSVLPGCEAAGSHAASAVMEGGALETFTMREGLDFEAFSALVIPTDDTPGAREAGTVYFADRALSSFFGFMLPGVRPGLADLVERAKAVDPAAEGFASLDEAAQLEIMRAVEQESPGFFGAARFLVAIGFASHPSYGGNRDQVGWQVMGFENTFLHAPPFGAYDRPVHEGGAS